MDEFSKIEKVRAVDFFKVMKSGIGIDAAKNHTGITIWDGNEVTTYGFALGDYNLRDTLDISA